METENAVLIGNLLKKDWNLYRKKLKEAEVHLEMMSYNIISISTYTGHLENYHSDIWGFLLDKEAAHKKGNLFLTIFIDYLISSGIVDKNLREILIQADTFRERGRIDVLIVNEEHNVCIIIENKINNAVDQDKQLERYRDKAQRSKWKIEAMLYVTAGGDILSTIHGDTRVYPIAACNNTSDCLLHSWIIPSTNIIDLNSGIIDKNIFSFLNQYAMLLETLTSKTNNNMNDKLLYETLNAREDFKTALLIQENIEKIKYHRVVVIKEFIEIHFKRKDYFKPSFIKATFYPDFKNHLIFLGFKHSNDDFKLEIIHKKDRTRFIFSCQNKNLEINQLQMVLEEIIGEHDFIKIEYEFKIELIISLYNKIESLSELDEIVSKFCINLFEKFNSWKN